ncbi:hypothetical protein VB796_08630 [Arcicella sp. LKC2W]|uniref:hypothetical protein n=1 Tax=Arcicella sp. LKC2W TaxID=2984198 RepID=UPI002B1F39D7|nr:hypothetical protein [Arcicella sp. LKC2W]MEA5459099.1 hypothetical protein [Arcicella sp. LKC2W]
MGLIGKTFAIKPNTPYSKFGATEITVLDINDGEVVVDKQITASGNKSGINRFTNQIDMEYLIEVAIPENQDILDSTSVEIEEESTPNTTNNNMKYNELNLLEKYILSVMMLEDVHFNEVFENFSKSPVFEIRSGAYTASISKYMKDDSNFELNQYRYTFNKYASQEDISEMRSRLNDRYNFIVSSFQLYA